MKLQVHGYWNTPTSTGITLCQQQTRAKRRNLRRVGANTTACVLRERGALGRSSKWKSGVPRLWSGN